MHQEIKLTSKRNEVLRIFEEDKTYISKTFASFHNFNKEKEILLVLKKEGANVPNIIESSNSKLLIEDLGEETLLNWYEKLEKHNSYDYENMLIKLCTWLKKFYRIISFYYNEEYVLLDVNFRNFIIKNDEIYGIDFEQSCTGNIETDAGKLTAYALTYEPSITSWKINFRNKFIEILSKELNIKRDLIIKEEKKEIILMESRRNTELNSYYNL